MVVQSKPCVFLPAADPCRAVLSACGSGSGDRRDEAQSTVRRAPAATSRIERCVDRLLQAATTRDASKEEARRYVRNTYCARFEREG
jgi:hypothetical protein